MKQMKHKKKSPKGIEQKYSVMTDKTYHNLAQRKTKSKLEKKLIGEEIAIWSIKELLPIAPFHQIQ